ncbi:MAG: hypothetical protein AAGE89_15525 [Pseudomonadota bacterium]
MKQLPDYGVSAADLVVEASPGSGRDRIFDRKTLKRKHSMLRRKSSPQDSLVISND